MGDKPTQGSEFISWLWGQYLASLLLGVSKTILFGDLNPSKATKIAFVAHQFASNLVVGHKYKARWYTLIIMQDLNLNGYANVCYVNTQLIFKDIHILKDFRVSYWCPVAENPTTLRKNPDSTQLALEIKRMHWPLWQPESTGYLALCHCSCNTKIPFTKWGKTQFVPSHCRSLGKGLHTPSPTTARSDSELKWNKAENLYFPLGLCLSLSFSLNPGRTQRQY